MTALGVMNLVDTLSVGGTERVAVNIANQLAERGHRSFLCTTRKEGKLAELVSPHVGRLALHRKRTLELDAIRRLTRFMKDHQIDVIHAHGSSILTANLASALGALSEDLVARPLRNQRAARAGRYGCTGDWWVGLVVLLRSAVRLPTGP